LRLSLRVCGDSRFSAGGGFDSGSVRCFAAGMEKIVWLLPLLGLALFTGCASKPPLKAVEHVDLPRFMGDWWVIAHIPYWLERDTYDSKDTYRMREDGKMDNIFSYRKGGFDGPEKVMNGIAWVVDKKSNAEWRVQFLWPIALPYYVLYLDPQYRFMAVGHPSRDYGWVMARDKRMSEADYAAVLEALAAQGYDKAKFRKVPQS
jgi:apolipoprotein D and lipocalin family protein